LHFIKKGPTRQEGTCTTEYISGKKVPLWVLSDKDIVYLMCIIYLEVNGGVKGENI
jgi:hypothetical protein